MTDTTHEAGGTGPSHRGVEVGVALAIATLGVIAVVGSMQIGSGWGAEGPQAGFFPFYIGLIIIIASAVNLTKIFLVPDDGALFANWTQLRQVASVVVPTTVYVFAIPYLGIYVASAVLIAVFMRWLGHYRWSVVAAVSIAVPIATFFMFEIWFLVPLPKGPLERMLGF
ncbi:tripartite tricarboxylate transporter TctB family protein [Microbacteriaceae bacterium K1510]|nr:tripartite tricarboxylate transporter TctB family protein [Microbacteriaceae bacterium K1510]